MAAHDWIVGDYKLFPGWDLHIATYRLCETCGASQSREQDHEWMRVTRTYWYPRVGRCVIGRARRDGEPSLIAERDVAFWKAKRKNPNLRRDDFDRDTQRSEANE